MDDDNQKEMTKAAPNEPWENLAYMLEKYHMIQEPGLEAARKFLAAGDQIDLPEAMDNLGEKIPYRLYPTPCYEIINSCVKVLEKEWAKEIDGGVRDPETEKEAIGVMCLANMLFSGTCSTPDGKFTIHWVKSNEGKIIMNPHGRRVRQLADRLEAYRTGRIAGAEARGEKLELPELTCQRILDQEEAISYTQWKGIDPKNWNGKRPHEINDSLDSLKDNLGFEASSQDAFRGEGAYGDGFEAQADVAEDIVDQANWMGIPADTIGSTLRFSEVQRGNVLARSPKAWLWNYREDPLEFAVDYVTIHAKPCLEEAHRLLALAIDNPQYQEAGSMALILDPANKNNPDTYWKIIKRIAAHFPSNRQDDPEAVLRKLDCARFTVCLESINLKLGVDPNKFQRIFKEKIHVVLGDPKRRDTITRNELLLETLGECTASEGKTGWSDQEKEIWLEHLQSAAVGAYENSVGMERRRQMLLESLNHLFKTPREEIEQTRNAPEEKRQELAAKLHRILTSASNSFYTALTGKTGQMTRRELRTKIQELKRIAENRGRLDLATRLGETARFVTSISSQVKSGDWYSKKEENVAQIFGFLTTMLECPKTGHVEFGGSREPEPKDPLEITCDFLRSMQGKQVLMGGQTLKAGLENCRECEMAHESGQLNEALKKITKTREKSRGEKKTLTQEIEDRQLTLESAIEIATKIHDSSDPRHEMLKWIEAEAEILLSPQNLETSSNLLFQKNLYFWKGIHYLAQASASRKEAERFQLKATIKGSLQNLIAMAKAKLRNKEIRKKNGEELPQFNLKETRERTLAVNISSSLGLWLAKDIKGVKNPETHEEFVETLKGRRDACEICLDISTSDQDIEEKITEFKEIHRRAKNLTNSYILSEVISMLDNPQELRLGLEWEIKNPKESAQLEEKYPELDSPTKKWNYLQRVKENPSMEIEGMRIS